jgi:hypothetical protein
MAVPSPVLPVEPSSAPLSITAPSTDVCPPPVFRFPPLFDAPAEAPLAPPLDAGPAPPAPVMLASTDDPPAEPPVSTTVPPSGRAPCPLASASRSDPVHAKHHAKHTTAQPAPTRFVTRRTYGKFLAGAV